MEIKEVQEVKFLGVIIDNNLHWKSHIAEVINKVSKLSGLIYKIRNLLDIQCLKQIYFSLIYPYFIYCCSVWGGAYATYIDKLFLAQKKLIRIITHNNKFDHTSPLFKDLKLLKVNDIIVFQTLTFVYRSLNMYTVDTGFQTLSHNIQLRQTGNLRTPLCRTSHAQRSVVSRGTKHWNLLPEVVRNKPMNSFKLFIKEQLRNNY